MVLTENDLVTVLHAIILKIIDIFWTIESSIHRCDLIPDYNICFLKGEYVNCRI